MARLDCINKYKLLIKRIYKNTSTRILLVYSTLLLYVHLLSLVVVYFKTLTCLRKCVGYSLPIIVVIHHFPVTN